MKISPMFYLRVSIVSALTFRLLIHFELIFVCGVIPKSVHSFAYGTPAVLVLFATDYSFPHWVVLAPLSWQKCWPQTYGYISGLSLIPLICMSFLMLLPYCFHYCKLCGKFWNWEVWVFQLCSFFKITVWLIGTHCNSIRIWGSASFLFCKKAVRISKEIALNL